MTKTAVILGMAGAGRFQWQGAVCCHLGGLQLAKWRLGAHCGAARCAPGNGPFGATFISLTVEIIFLAANPGNRGLAKTLLPPGGLGDVVGTVPLPTTWTKNGRTAVFGPCGGQGGGGRFWPAQKRFFAFTKAATAAIPKPPRWHRCSGLAVPRLFC